MISLCLGVYVCVRCLRVYVMDQAISPIVVGLQQRSALSLFLFVAVLGEVIHSIQDEVMLNCSNGDIIRSSRF